MRRFFIFICFFCTLLGFASCSDDHDSEDHVLGGCAPHIFLSKDTFEYDYGVLTDTIVAEGVSFSIESIYDMDDEKSASYSYENNCIQHKWIKVEVKGNELLLSLTENPEKQKRGVYMWLRSGLYSQKIYIIQHGNQ